jgi:hypothetical protein
MIAEGIVGIEVPLAAHGVCRQLGLHFLDENAVTHSLRGIDFTRAAGKASLQIADATENIVFLRGGSRRRPSGLGNSVTIKDVNRLGDSPVSGLPHAIKHLCTTGK